MREVQAQVEFRRIVTEELPAVKVKFINGVRYFASKHDAALSRKLSTRLAKLHAIFESRGE